VLLFFCVTLAAPRAPAESTRTFDEVFPGWLVADQNTAFKPFKKFRKSLRAVSKILTSFLGAQP
jgi:hypothetical protein